MKVQSRPHFLGILLLSYLLPLITLGTIQEQIDAAFEGGVVLVDSGTYVENINFNGKNITVRSTYGPDVTIIDGNGNGSTVSFISGETSAVLNGFTITNGSGTLNDSGHRAGGGIVCRNNSTPTLMNLIIEGNNAVGDSATGGGITCSYGSDALIQDVIIRNNEADYAGGFCAYEANPTLERVEVYGNHARVTGGGLTFWNSASQVDELQVYDNTAYYSAAGIWVHNFATPVLNRVTVTGNACTYSNTSYITAGGVGVSMGSAPILINSILWDNYPNEIEFYGSLETNQIGVYASDVEGGEATIETNDNGTVTWGLGNIDQNPEFMDADNRNFILDDSSPCIDMGTAYLVIGADTLVDITHPDFWGANPDMGAWETLRPNIVLEVPGTFSGIQNAIDYAIDGDIIEVAAGTYYENINYLGKNIVVVSNFGPELTIIDGSPEDMPTVVISNGESRSAVLDGFTIQNGRGNPNRGLVSAYRFGGGLCVRFGSNPTLRNLIITDNSVPIADSFAGGIGVAFGSEPLLENIIIQNNTARFGAGMYSHHSAPVLSNVTIRNNQARNTGGGVMFGTSTPTINSITVYGNTAGFGGGGLWFHEECEAVVNQATIYGNEGGTGGGGILLIDDNNIFLVNSICWGNSPNQIESYLYAPDNWIESHIGIANSTIQDGPSEQNLLNDELIFYENNLLDNPLFTDPELGDFSLTESSPCIDAGTAFLVWENDTLVDISSDEYIGLAPDMGAIESAFTVLVHEDLGLPNEHALHQNYPNPFNPTTTIRYDLAESSPVSITIYDIMGRTVVNLDQESQPAGWYDLQWQGLDRHGVQMSTGVYFCRLSAGSFNQTIKMLYLK